MKKLIFISLLLTACATPYQSSGIRGGYSEKKISDDVYNVVFEGNGFTSKESVQTYWLYRASEITLEKGYDYFEILNSLMSGLDFYSEGLDSYLVAQMVFIPIDQSNKPLIEREIKLHKKPFSPEPPKSFDAKKLKSILEPLVKGKLCDNQVCPHEKKYLKK